MATIAWHSLLLDGWLFRGKQIQQLLKTKETFLADLTQLTVLLVWINAWNYLLKHRLNLPVGYTDPGCCHKQQYSAVSQRNLFSRQNENWDFFSGLCSLYPLLLKFGINKIHYEGTMGPFSNWAISMSTSSSLRTSVRISSVGKRWEVDQHLALGLIQIQGSRSHRHSL